MNVGRYETHSLLSLPFPLRWCPPGSSTPCLLSCSWLVQAHHLRYESLDKKKSINMRRRRTEHHRQTRELLTVECSRIDASLILGIPSGCVHSKGRIGTYICFEVNHPIVPSLDGRNFGEGIGLAGERSILDEEILDVIPCSNFIHASNHLLSVGKADGYGVKEVGNPFFDVIHLETILGAAGAYWE